MMSRSYNHHLTAVNIYRTIFFIEADLKFVAILLPFEFFLSDFQESFEPQSVFSRWWGHAFNTSTHLLSETQPW